MSTECTFYTSLTSEEVLTDHFSKALQLESLSTEGYQPLVNDLLWVSIQVELDEDWAEEAAMLGSENISLVTFVVDKQLAWAERTQQISMIMRAILTLWNTHPASTGAFGVDELLLMQRLPHAPIMVDRSVADTSAEGLNAAHAFDDLIDTVELADIKTDI